MRGFNSSYDLLFKDYKLGRISLKVTGKHNIQNSLLARIHRSELDIPFPAIQDGLGKFSGVYRRFDLKGEAGGITVYDDYAHHPTVATLEALRIVPKRKFSSIPAIYTQGPIDFYEEFGKSFFSCDCLILAPIYILFGTT